MVDELPDNIAEENTDVEFTGGEFDNHLVVPVGTDVYA